MLILSITNSILLFRSYLLVFLCLLIPLFFLINVEVYQIIKKVYGFYLHSYSSRNNLNLNSFNLWFEFYVISKQWLLCISMIELFYLSDIIKSDLAFISLAYCYRNINCLEIAEYYYLITLSYVPNDISLLKNLASVYDQLGQYDKAINVYRDVIKLSKEESIPDFYSNLV
uniref:Uncharacterized protein n=1 Tax=Dasyclonium flaccidum TaxID=2007274 RepID=A0A1Z1MKA5_9FLOR|nr:hypothetical protein [Dasyclonium flaccidum]ARW66530.1 hypothetical protein [Dasyclonium flaccidum]